jgi:hypothetical protein
MPNYQEQNAKADQMGAGIALGCIGIPAILFLALILIVALVA